MLRNAIIVATAATISFILPIVTSCNIANAGDLRLLSAGALESSVISLIPDFERSSGHKVKAEFGPAGAMASRIQKGEAVDVGIVTTAQIDALITQGRILSGTQVAIAKVGLGIATRRGAAKPDIGSVEAFKRVLLAAKSIAHSDPASGTASGPYAAQLLGSLDVATELKSKIKLFASAAPLFEALAKGDVELGFGQITEILATPSIELVGPLPPALQNFTRFSIGLVATSKEPEESRALISFLTTPAAAAVMKEKGFDPR